MILYTLIYFRRKFNSGIVFVLEKKPDSPNLRTVVGLTKTLTDLMSHFHRQICHLPPQTKGINKLFLEKNQDSPNLRTVDGLTKMLADFMSHFK